MRITVLLCLSLVAVLPLGATEPCRVIRGRAHLYGGDGQLRIWRLGPQHEYSPDPSSRPRVMKWLEAGASDSDKAKYASPAILEMGIRKTARATGLDSKTVMMISHGERVKAATLGQVAQFLTETGD